MVSPCASGNVRLRPLILNYISILYATKLGMGYSAEAWQNTWIEVDMPSDANVMYENPAGLVAFRQLVRAPARNFWVCYQLRFETQSGYWCRDVTYALLWLNYRIEYNKTT